MMNGFSGCANANMKVTAVINLKTIHIMFAATIKCAFDACVNQHALDNVEDKELRHSACVVSSDADEVANEELPCADDVDKATSRACFVSSAAPI